MSDDTPPQVVESEVSLLIIEKVEYIRLICEVAYMGLVYQSDCDRRKSLIPSIVFSPIIIAYMGLGGPDASKKLKLQQPPKKSTVTKI